MPSGSTMRGGRSTSSPEIAKRSSPCGFSSVRRSSAKPACSQEPCVRRFWVAESASRRSMNFCPNSLSEGALRRVCEASDCTVVSVFFTRWFSSCRRKRWRSSGSLRAAMSRRMTWFAYPPLPGHAGRDHLDLDGRAVEPEPALLHRRVGDAGVAQRQDAPPRPLAELLGDEIERGAAEDVLGGGGAEEPDHRRV